MISRHVVPNQAFAVLIKSGGKSTVAKSRPDLYSGGKSSVPVCWACLLRYQGSRLRRGSLNRSLRVALLMHPNPREAYGGSSVNRDCAIANDHNSPTTKNPTPTAASAVFFSADTPVTADTCQVCHGPGILSVRAAEIF